jgi:hypothetical protein
MKLILQVALFAAMLNVMVCTAQSTNSKTAAIDWGKPVCGAQMSIIAANNDFIAGSNIVLVCQITNSSTNVLGMHYTGQPQYDFSISLLDSAGKSCDLKPDDHGLPRQIYMNTLIGVNPNEIYKCDIPIHLYSTIPSGDYELSVKIGIFVQKQWYILISNSLAVHVKHP